MRPLFPKTSGVHRASLASELWRFMWANKKWWMLPIVVVFLLLALIAFLSATGTAPFIYTLF